VKIAKYLFENIESLFCRGLLVGFVSLLFVQIISREVFASSISWIEELSVYMFVWFVFLGASEAARISAHNRVTFQFNFIPQVFHKYIELLGDLFWLYFNCYFVYLSYDFVFNKMNKFWKSQTLGVEMKYVYIILPLAFTLMTIRILQVNYNKFFKGIELEDPDKVNVDDFRQDNEKGTL